jgi:TonB-dependent receptor
MKNKPKMRRSKLVGTITATLAATALCGADSVLAQDDAGALEEVVVTGIRGSLQRSMDIKRDAAGVVDAISAEDMGKFPDTNLAESLQRITGVSIDRRNGEGSEITVRGFGAANNLVTLNGRTMPGGLTYGGGSGAGGTRGGATRSFDFSNIASETVSGVDVYKTGRASISSGGIGATVDIKTLRPLEQPGLNASVSLKAIHDTTVGDNGDDFTPELSGLVSWTDADETLGLGFTFSYSERDSGFAGGSANNWNIGTWDSTDDPTDGYNGYSLRPDPVSGVIDVNSIVQNAPADGQLFARPNDFRWTYSELSRERTNAQLVAQFAPTDAITLTLDYTYAENELWEHRGEWTMWIHNSSTVDSIVFDDSPVATPVYIHETTFNKDIGYEQQLREQTNELESIGFNLDWDVTDTLNLAFDFHDSSMDSLPSGPGDSGSIALSVGAPIANEFEYDFSGELPVGNLSIDDSNNGNNNGVLDEPDLGSAQGRIWYAGQTMDIQQFRIDGVMEMENGHFDFGIDSRSVETTQQSSNRQVDLGQWGVTNPGEFSPGSFIVPFNFASKYEDYNTSNMYQSGARAVDVYDLCLQTEVIYGTSQDWVCEIERNFTADNKIEEDILGAYFQFAIESELGGMPTNLLAGLRYEKTDLTSTALLRQPLYRVWQDNNDFQVTEYASEDKVPISVDNDYSNMLPSLDFDIAFTEDLKGRFSYSKTIARANYGNLYAGAAGFGQTDPTYYIGSQPTATRTSPELLPLESDNYDLSLEWYYGDSSYASAGVFEKRVKNFIGTGQALETHYGMRDASNGPRVRRAADELETLGVIVDATSLFVMTAILDNPADYPNGAADFQTDGTGTVVDPQFAIDVAAAYDIHALFSGPDADPETVWLTSFPQNNKEAKINGFEFAVQHFFGDTGFGLQANYTVVNGDISFDDLAPPTESQFALLGLSDTANLVFIYENFGFEARLAYNWRDEFLRQTNQGGSRNPVYVDEYEQWDLNVAYNITDQFSVFMEGLNLTEENTRWHNRSDHMTFYLEDLGARYQFGARYTF